MNIYRRYIFPLAYDRFMDREPMTSVRRELCAVASGRVLDVGFGTGLDLRWYGAEVTAVVGLDRNPGMFLQSLTRATEVTIPTTVVMGNAEKLPFPRNSFDTVVTTFTLCSIDDVRSAIAEIGRVLRPGGSYLFVEHGMGTRFALRWWHRPLKVLQWLWGDGCRIDRDIPHLVEAEGFRVESLKAIEADRRWPIIGQTWSGRAQGPYR